MAGINNISINENEVCLYTTLSSEESQKASAVIRLYWKDVFAIAIWRTLDFDDDTTYVFVFSKANERYVVNTNRLSVEAYSKLSREFEAVLSVPFESHFSLPTVVYPSIAFGCPLFKNNWWFKIKWNVFSSFETRLSQKVSSCLSDLLVAK
ncbi:MAG: hypothetical protein AAF741_03185 [Bacteroidota bacterium]